MPQHDDSLDRHHHKQEPAATKKNNYQDEPFPTYQLTILAICRFSEPIAFSSILAYTYVMVQDLNGTDVNASFYAGLLVSAYAVAEALTAMIWGAISDRYGRKPIVLFGLVGVAISSLLFGLAESYWVALVARFVGGALNGNVSVMQTMVAEMVKNPEHEPKAYAVQPFVWFLGSIIGSAMGGYLAQPAKFYPGVFSEDGLFGQYPYLLPNLVAVAVVVIAVVQGIIFLDETNPACLEERSDKNKKTHHHHQQEEEQDDTETSPLLQTVSHTKSVAESLRESVPFFGDEGLPTATDPRFDLRHNSFGTMHSISVRPDIYDLQQQQQQQQEQQRPEQQQQQQPKSFNFAVVMLIISLVVAASHQMAFGAIFPIYLLDPPSSSSSNVTISTPRLDLTGGMGFSLHDVGGYLAASGFIALFSQGVLFPLIVEKTGVWLSFLVPVIVYPLCYIIIPFLSLLRPDEGEGEGWALPLGIYASLFLQNLLGILMYPCALILLKNACPSPLVLGKVNGLAMSAVCAARTVASPLVGVVYDFGGSSAAWGSCALVAIIGAVQLWWVPRDATETSRHAEVHVENALIGRPNNTHAVVLDEDAIEDEEEEEEVTRNHQYN